MEGNKMDDEQSEAFKQWTEDSARKQALANEEIETFEAIRMISRINCSLVEFRF